MFASDPTRCPNCGERVTPYAAGCAICGAELDPTRWHSPPSKLSRMINGRRRPRPPRLGRRTRA